MKTIFTLCLLIIFVRLHAQVVTVYEDLFTNSCDGTTGITTCSNGATPNNNKWNYTDQDAGTGVSWKFTGGEGYLQNQYGVNYDYGYSLLFKGGDGYYTGDRVYDQDASFLCRFTNNTENLEWTFNFKASTTPWGLTNGAQTSTFGGAFVIGMDSPTLYSCSFSTIGYAVIFGDASGSGNNVKLVRFSGGTTGTCGPATQAAYTFFNWNGTNSSTCIISDNADITSSWYSVKVQYNPSNDEWRLFVRNDGGTKADPQTLNSTHGKGAKIDNTYTGNNLRIMGFYGAFSDNNSLKSIRFDNLRIKRNVSLISVTTNNVCGSISALPVELTSFDLNNEANKTVKLEWQTASELRNEKFIVERSENGNDFYSIGEVKGNGTTQEKQDYEFIDTKPKPGILYYRLKQMDYDGKHEIHKTISTEISMDDFIVFPNPAKDIISLSFKNKDLVPEKIELMNYTGEIIEVNFNKEEAIYHFDINVLPKGIYFIKVHHPNGLQVKNFIISK